MEGPQPVTVLTGHCLPILPLSFTFGAGGTSLASAPKSLLSHAQKPRPSPFLCRGQEQVSGNTGRGHDHLASSSNSYLSNQVTWANPLPLRASVFLPVQQGYYCSYYLLCMAAVRTLKAKVSKHLLNMFFTFCSHVTSWGPLRPEEGGDPPPRLPNP